MHGFLTIDRNNIIDVLLKSWSCYWYKPVC